MDQQVIIEVTFCRDWNRGLYYDLKFPISEIENCLALFGWTLTNEMPISGPVREAINRLREPGYMTMPDDPQAWVAKFATKRQERPFGGILDDMGAVVIC